MQKWAERFYSSGVWRSTQKAFLTANPECELCRAEGEEGSLAKIAHHKVWLTRQNINDPKITLDWGNLQAVCQKHHNQIHHRTEQKRNYDFLPDGTLIRRTSPHQEQPLRGGHHREGEVN